MSSPVLRWLPETPDWLARLKAAEQASGVSWAGLVALAGERIDFLRAERLDRLLQARFPVPPDRNQQDRVQGEPIRLAILGSSTVAHLHAPIRVAALRRGLWLTTYETDYGQYRQELLDPSCGLHRFRPTAVLLALDARHMTQGVSAEADDAGHCEQAITQLRQCWRLAREAWQCTVLQQTVLPVLPAMLGQNEQRLPGSAAGMVARLNARLRAATDEDGVHLVAIDATAAQDGVRSWHNPVLWLRAKQDISPAAAPMYGDLVVRVLAAQAGRSAKCLVLDLDNTLWGGVIGDDGLDGIVLGQNSPLGEAFAAVQDYALQLARRGVILAVCSKNNEADAAAVFDHHPEMTLRRSDIASFVVNWDDKATNLRRIAQELNIGLDALVFLDDNPFERNLVRQELPEVMVPEVPDDDPASVPEILADAGYFESVALTGDDLARTAQYQAGVSRRAQEAQATDLPGYLRSLQMRLVSGRFDRIGFSRIVQLINKTNQFNLTTRRYSDGGVLALMADPAAFGLQFRLLDRFGDNGIIGIVIGRLEPGRRCVLDTWLMSCRVLGRQVEEATLNVVAGEARAMGAMELIGEYRATPRNGMVAGHYERLGFSRSTPGPDGAVRFSLALDGFAMRPVAAIELVDGVAA